MSETAPQMWAQKMPDAASAVTADLLTARERYAKKVLALVCPPGERLDAWFTQSPPEASTGPAFQALLQIQCKDLPGFTRDASLPIACVLGEFPQIARSFNEIQLGGYAFSELQNDAFTYRIATSFLIEAFSEIANGSTAKHIVWMAKVIAPSVADPLESARESLAAMPASPQRARANELLNEIGVALRGVQGASGRMQALVTDDGAILLEWFAPHKRIGFSIEPDPAESGWFLVSDSTLGDVVMSGAMSHPGVSSVIDMFFRLRQARP